jgi:serine/threonine protein kinase
VLKTTRIHTDLLSSDEEEDEEDYRRGGYHPVQIGNIYNHRFRILSKLGWGHFSTVWLALDQVTQKEVALKIVKSAKQYTEVAKDEISILKKVTENDKDDSHCIVHLIDSFEHQGPNGIHIGMVFEILGCNLLSIVRLYKSKGLPMPLVKIITKQVLMALDYLHTDCSVIHTDLKPENVLLRVNPILAVDQLNALSEAGKTGLANLSSSLECEPTSSGTSATASPSSAPLGGVVGEGKEAKKAMEVVANEEDRPKANSEETAALAGVAMEEASEGVNQQGNRIAAALGEDSAKSELNGSSGGVPQNATRQTESVASLSERVAYSASDRAAPTSGGPKSEANPSAQPVANIETVAEVKNNRTAHTTDAETAAMGSRNSGIPGASSSPPSLPETLATRHSESSGSSDPLVSAGNTPRPQMIETLPTDKDGLLRVFGNGAFRCKIADLGNACWTYKHFTDDVQTRHYRAPEVILGYKSYDTPIDIWSLACIVFELLTGDLLFEPHGGKNYSKDDDHLAQIMELLGRLPRDMVVQGKYSSDYLTRGGDLRNIKTLRFWGLKEVFVEKYKYSATEAANIASFLLPMLEYTPGKRATAREALRHAWIRDVDVNSFESCFADRS